MPAPRPLRLPAPRGPSPGRAWIPRAAAGLVLLTLLAGCGSDGRPPVPTLQTILYIAVGQERAPDLNAELDRQKRLRSRFALLERSFQEVHPGVQLELLVFDQDRFVDEVRRRTHSGLAPDLILVDGVTAERLHQRQLISPISVPNPASELVLPALVPYVQAGRGQWFAMPVGQEPQLACFDRRRLAQSPPTVGALLEASSRGQRIGMTFQLDSLAWTMGSLGALESIARVRRGASTSLEQIRPIQHWLGWLRNADLQQRITVMGTQGELTEGLREGRFDWISCRSQDASLLRADLGDHLGLAPLPSGPGGPASPISTVRVWAFGRNSSTRQRRAAQALVRFTLNPPVQRAFSIQTQGLLPVSRSATLPVASSANLAALLAAQRQAVDAQDSAQVLISLRSQKEELNQILTRFRYGELDTEDATTALIEALRRKPHE